MLLGYLEIVLRRMPRFSLPVSPALLLAVPSCLFFALPGVFNFSNSLVLVRLWGILVVALCTLVASAGLGRANRILVLLGDASYSTYLFHLLIYEWTTPSILAIYTRLHSTPASPWAFIAAAVLAANLLGLAIHLAVERPMTRALRRLTFGPFRFLNDQ
jgi:peptidoglycan/LPS O-acetylase OafA/YrhL